MPAYTPFLNLYKMGGGSTGLITPDETVDVDRINQNMDAIDSNASSWGNPAQRNHQFYGSAAGLASITGMKRGDTYQESDGNFQTWRYDGSNWVTNTGGMFLIRPSSVVNATIDTSGATIPNAATSFSVNGVFSSRFQKYKIEFYRRNVANSSDTLKLRNAGSDTTGNDYAHQSIEAVGTTSTLFRATGQNSMSLGAPNGTNGWGTVEVTNPGAAGTNKMKTFYYSGGTMDSGSPSTSIRSGFLLANDTNTFDGFTIASTSGSNYDPSSWFKVYGMA